MVNPWAHFSRFKKHLSPALFAYDTQVRHVYGDAVQVEQAIRQLKQLEKK
jgi:hypothetical protein